MQGTVEIEGRTAIGPGEWFSGAQDEQEKSKIKPQRKAENPGKEKEEDEANVRTTTRLAPGSGCLVGKQFSQGRVQLPRCEAALHSSQVPFLRPNGMCHSQCFCFVLRARN